MLTVISIVQHWAGTLLGLLEAICIPIPFVFYRYGGKIRQKSTLIRQMRENKEKQDRRRKRAEEKTKRNVDEKGEVVSVKEKCDGVFEEPQAEKDVEKGEVNVETKSQ